ncbi:MAG: hypothetical protein AAEJ52_20760 [Myxococcota bacterium]
MPYHDVANCGDAKSADAASPTPRSVDPINELTQATDVRPRRLGKPATRAGFHITLPPRNHAHKTHPTTNTLGLLTEVV